MRMNIPMWWTGRSVGGSVTMRSSQGRAATWSSPAGRDGRARHWAEARGAVSEELKAKGAEFTIEPKTHPPQRAHRLCRPRQLMRHHHVLTKFGFLAFSQLRLRPQR